MSKYFKFVGYVGLIGVIGVLIWRFIAFGDLMINHSDLPNYGDMVFIHILIILITIVFGPATGLLFVMFGEHLEPRRYKPVNQQVVTEEHRYGDNWNTNPSTNNIGHMKNQSMTDSWGEIFKKKEIIDANNEDKHLSFNEVNELMKLSIEELEEKFKDQ